MPTAALARISLEETGTWTREVTFLSLFFLSSFTFLGFVTVSTFSTFAFLSARFAPFLCTLSDFAMGGRTRSMNIKKSTIKNLLRTLGQVDSSLRSKLVSNTTWCLFCDIVHRLWCCFSQCHIERNTTNRGTLSSNSAFREALLYNKPLFTQF